MPTNYILAFLHPHLILFLTNVLILSYDCIIFHVGYQRGSHSMLHEHRVEQGIQDARISAVCFTTCSTCCHTPLECKATSGFKSLCHKAVVMTRSRADAQSDKLGKCIPDLGIGVYKAFSFALLPIFMRSESTAGL